MSKIEFTGNDKCLVLFANGGFGVFTEAEIEAGVNSAVPDIRIHWDRAEYLPLAHDSVVQAVRKDGYTVAAFQHVCKRIGER